MAFNLPTYDTQNFSFGPGVLYIGPVGTTPTLDVGAVRAGAELAVARERLEVRQGSTRNLVQQYVTQETVTLTVTGIEWNLENLTYALGAGVTTAGLDYRELAFGGDLMIREAAVRFKHEMPNGDVLWIDIWRAQGAGEITITFGEDLHEFPFSFSALDTDSNWAGQALPENGKLFRIRRELA